MNGTNLMTRRTEARKKGTGLLPAMKGKIKQTAIMEEALGEEVIPAHPISLSNQTQAKEAKTKYSTLHMMRWKV